MAIGTRRALWLFPVALLTASAAAQHEHPGMMHKPAAGVKLVVRNDSATKTLLVRLGPMDLPAHSDHMQVAQPPDLYWSVPFDGWLVAYHPQLMDASGKPVPGRLLHHVAFWNTRRSDFLCPNKQEHIFGAGGEMSDWPEVSGYGYQVRKGERIRVSSMFHNPTATSHPQTYLEVTVHYRLPSPSSPPLKGVYPAWIDVMECRSSGYMLPAGHSVTTGEIVLQHSGRLLGVGGHLHDYAKGLVLEDLTTKQEIASLPAGSDSEGHLVSMPVKTFFDIGGFPLRKDDRLRVSATYDNSTGKPLPDGAMGIVVGYFLPDRDAEMAVLIRKPK